uniref:Uncharacterized protein n=1 Tax=Oryza meridionalis TaxID=40149 RepID=A0A0E0F722_9ORYZ
MSSRRCRHFMHPPPAGAALAVLQPTGLLHLRCHRSRWGAPVFHPFRRLVASSSCLRSAEWFHVESWFCSMLPRRICGPSVSMPQPGCLEDTLDYGRMALQVSIVDKDSSKKYHSNLLEQYGDIKVIVAGIQGICLYWYCCIIVSACSCNV